MYKYIGVMELCPFRLQYSASSHQRSFYECTNILGSRNYGIVYCKCFQLANQHYHHSDEYTIHTNEDASETYLSVSVPIEYKWLQYMVYRYICGPEDKLLFHSSLDWNRSEFIKCHPWRYQEETFFSSTESKQNSCRL